MQVVVVLDTNVLIEEWDLFESLMSLIKVLSADSQDRLNFIVPWVVIQELDRLKEVDNFRRDDMGHRRDAAQRASSLLTRLMLSDSDMIIGQRPSESILVSTIPDDQIVDCASYFHQQRQSTSRRQEYTVVWSNDRILALKAAVHGIHTVSFCRDAEGFFGQLNAIIEHHTRVSEQCMDWQDSSCNDTSKTYVHLDEMPPISEALPEHSKSMNSSVNKSSISSKMVDVFTTIQESGEFQRALILAFNRIIGPSWTRLCRLSPTAKWSTAQCIRTLEQFWIPVFSQVISRHARDMVRRVDAVVNHTTANATLVANVTAEDFQRDLETILRLLGLHEEARVVHDHRTAMR